jgi:hypothetical protein
VLSTSARASASASSGDGRVVALAQRIASLLREREANERASEAAASTFDLPETPAELMMTYRGPLGPLKVEVDPDWIRDVLPDFSPFSRRGRKLRRLLRIHERHYARMWADREASGIGPLIEERRRIKDEIEALATEACSLGGSSWALAALQAAALSCQADGVRDVPAALLALLEVAGAA